MKFTPFLVLHFFILLISGSIYSYSPANHNPGSGFYFEDSTKTAYEQGLKELAAKNYEKAVRLINQYLAVHDLDEAAFIQRGNAYLGLLMYKEAIADYEAAGKIGHNNPEVPYRIGIVYLTQKDFEKAEAEQLKAVKMNDAYGPAYEQLGDIAMMKNDTTGAVDYYKQALTADPEMDDVLFKLGGLFLSQNKTEEALEYFNNAISRKPANSEYYYNAGLAYYTLNDTANTLKYMEVAVKLNPSYAQGFYTLANIYASQGRYDDAISSYTKAINIKASGLMPSVLRTARGRLYALKNDNANALKDFESAIMINKSDTLAFLGRGQIYAAEGKDSLAFLDFDKALSFNPDIATALVFRGKIYLTMFKYEDAEKDLTRAYELAPKDTVVLYTLGNAYLEQDKFQEAIKYYDKAINANPNFYKIYENRGVAYYNLGFFRQAKSDFENAMKHDASLVSTLQPLYLDAKAKAGM